MITITLDQASLDRLNKQMDVLRDGGKKAVSWSIRKIGDKIKNEAQMRLRGQTHIITSRLRNSLFVKTSTKPDFNFSDNKGNSFVSDLKTVSLDKGDIAIGTNVEYAEKIEMMDSYLEWAVRNVDVSRSIQQDMQNTMENVMKFGAGIIPEQ